MMYMKNKTIHLPVRALWCSLCALVLLVLAGQAFAQTGTQLTDVQYQALPGNQVQLTLTFAGGPVPQPRIFTTAAPARIAVDLAGTTNAFGKRHVDIGVGATEGLSVVSAGNRTRLVVDLLRPSNYESHVRGNTLEMIISNGEGAGTGTRATALNPTKTVPAQMGSAELTHIGFRRGAKGQGRVLVDFTGSGLQSSIDQSNGKVQIHLQGVRVPSKFAQRLDVLDFATPVQSIDTNPSSNGATLTLTVSGQVVASSYKADQQLVIEVAKKPIEKPVNIGEKQKKSYEGRRVTFNFQDISVRAALQLLAEISHLNMVAADSVGGSVTLHLTNVPWDQALDVILRAKGLAKRKDGNVIWIAPQQELLLYEQREAEARMKARNTADLVVAFIPISYGKARDIATLLTSGAKRGGGGGGNIANAPRGFLSPRGSVSFDIRTNTLLVNDTPKKIEEIRNLVAVLDRPVEQVLIQARIVAASNDFVRDLGVRWGLQGWQTTGSNRYGVGGDTQGANDAANGNITMDNGSGLNVNLPVANPAGSVGLAILGANYLVDLELQAAQTEGRTEIISSPRVITANQQEANIQQGQQIGYVTMAGGTAGGLGTATVQFKNAVLELKVTPTITADKRVFLKINLKKDALNRFIDNPGGGQVPLLDHRELNTSVLVDNGRTVVLGGIYEINKKNSVTKVPGLGDIPILGALFRKTSRSSSKAELLIFVTPRILSDTGT